MILRAQTTADVIVYGSTPGGFCFSDSSPVESHRVAYSLDMTDWSSTLDSGIPVDTGDTTTRAFNLASAGIDTEPRMFFRVEME